MHALKPKFPKPLIAIDIFDILLYASGMEQEVIAMEELSFLYEKIYHDLSEDIKSGRRQAGDKLPTEQELAECYGVSRITSKRALNMLANEGVATRRRGLGTFVSPSPADKPAQAVSSRSSFTLKPQQTRRIGLIMEDLGESYSLSLFYELERQAAQRNMMICVEVSYGDQINERRALHRLLSLKLDGLLIMPAHGQYYNTDLLRLVLDHFPVAVIDRPLHGIPAPGIYSDNEKAADELTSHLISQGYRSIAYVTGDMKDAISLEDRYIGYERAMFRAGLEAKGPVVVPRISRFGPNAQNMAQERLEEERYVRRWLEETPRIDAVIGSEYSIAHIARLAAVSLGKRVPQDLAICCFDAKYGYLGEYEFTHIKQDETAIAAGALDVLCDMLAGKNMRRQTRLIPAQLMTGPSTLRT